MDVRMNMKVKEVADNEGAAANAVVIAFRSLGLPSTTHLPKSLHGEFFAKAS